MNSRKSGQRSRISRRPPAAVHDHFAGPEEETKVPCPVCRKGMVSPTVAAAVNAALESVGDGPEIAPPSPKKKASPR